MSTTVDRLLIEIGGDTRGLVRSLDRAQQRLDRMGERMQRFGARMTAAVTAPLLGLAGASLKAAGDFEKLEKGLEALMGSSEAAGAELAKLRAEAKKPGLGFKQAVQGSLSLQAVGFSADTAREALSEFGNALALSGGSADDLGEVIRQLSQVQSLGKITAENMNVIRERVPLVGRAMQSAFGTTSIEAIRETGISTDAFIKQLIEGLGEIERAEGGLSNAFVNLRMAGTGALTAIGDALNESFDVQGTLESLSGRIDAFSQTLRRLTETNPQLVKMAGVVAGVAAAAGPLAFTLGTVAKAAALISAPVLGATAAVAGLGAGAVLAYQHWDKLSAFLEKRFGGALERVKALLAGARTFAVETFTYILDTVQPVVEELWRVVTSVLADLRQFWSVWGGAIMAIVSTAFQNVWTLAKTLFSSLADIVRGGLRYVGDVIGFFLDLFSGDFSGAFKHWKSMWSGLFTTLGKLVLRFVKVFLDNLGRVVSYIPGVGEAMASGLETASEGVQGALDGLEGGFAESEESGEKWSSKLVGFADTVKNAFRGVASGLNAAAPSAGGGGSGDGSGSASGGGGGGKAGSGADVDVAKNAQGAGTLGPNALTGEDIGEYKSPLEILAEKAGIAMPKLAGHYERAKEATSALAASMAEKSQAIAQTVSAGMQQAAAGFLEGVGAMLAGQATLGGVVNSVLMTLADLAIRVGKIAIAVGFGVAGIKKALQSLNPVVAIAAGAALIALGGAAKAALSSAASGSGGGGGFSAQAVDYTARPRESGGRNAGSGATAQTAAQQTPPAQQATPTVAVELKASVLPSGDIVFAQSEGRRRLDRFGTDTR